MNYTTVFKWSKNKKLYVFYKYDKIGYIPTGIDFTYRNNKYNTINIMNLLASAKVKHHKKYLMTDWYDLETGIFDKKEFIKFQNTL